MSYDGIQYNNRVDNFTERKLAAKVTDQVLNSVSYATRLFGMGGTFAGKTHDETVKVVDSGLGEFYTNLETLSTAASDTTITLSYARTAFTQPEVSSLLEAMANSGPEGTINLQVFKKEEAIAEAVSRLGSAIYGTGTGNQPLGLGAIVDDATVISTIGGQARGTYTCLKATLTASGGTMTLAKLATLEDTISGAGLGNEEPNISNTTKTVWSLYESLLHPTQRNNYNGSGVLPIRGNTVMARNEMGAQAGFTSLMYRGKPVVKDDACTAGVWFMLNERYFGWKGQATVPTDYTDYIQKISLGDPRTIDGVPASFNPPSVNGWFYQPKQMLPAQSGMIGRIHVIGQVTANSFRRQGKLTAITGVA